MALLGNITCSDCGQLKSVMYDPAKAPPKVCKDCRAVRVADKRKEHFAALDALSMEERVRRIEEWIYDFKFPVHPSDVRF